MRRILSACFALALLLLAGCGPAEPETVETDNIIRPARIMTVASSSNDTIWQYAARIEALQTVDLSFEVPGPLKELPIKEGETVLKGALIAALDNTDFELGVRESEVQLRLAAQDLSRKRKVLEDNGIARSQVDDAMSHYRLQQVRLEQAKERLKDTRLTAPFDAYVSRRYVDQHVNIAPGTPVVRLLDLTRLQVVFHVPEQLAATATADQIIESWAEFPFAPGRKFAMTFHENRGEADGLAQTYEVSFLTENPEEFNVLPGMTATAKIHLKGLSSGQMLIPASALVPGADNALTVWVYDPDSQLVTQRQVETGAPTQDGVPVLGGISAGEMIVVTGANQLQAGMKIRPL